MATAEQSGRKLVRIQQNGRVTLPANLRKSIGLKSGDLVTVILTEDGLLITPTEDAKTVQDSSWLRDLYDYFAPVRDEVVEKGYTEEEVNADIDAAVRAVRAERAAKDDLQERFRNRPPFPQKVA